MSFQCQINYTFDTATIPADEFTTIIESYNLFCQLYNGKINMQTLQTKNTLLTFTILFENKTDCLQFQKCVNQLSELANILKNETAENILKIWRPFFILKNKNDIIN